MHFPTRVRAALAAASVLLVLAAPVSGRASTLDVLAKLASLLAKAGDIVSNLAEGIEDANAAGLRIYDTHAARAAYNRLLDLRTDILVLPMVQRDLVIDPIDTYLAAPDPAAWPEVQGSLQDVLAKVIDVEQRLTEERSDFVLESGFAELLQIIRSRGGLLLVLLDVPPPRTEAELAELRRTRERYATLIAELERARLALDNYLRRTRPSSGAP